MERKAGSKTRLKSSKKNISLHHCVQHDRLCALYGLGPYSLAIHSPHDLTLGLTLSTATAFLGSITSNVTVIIIIAKI